MATINVLLADEGLTFTSSNGRTTVIRFAERPEVFQHPRHIVADFDRAEALIHQSLRSITGKWNLFAPRVELTIEKKLAGGWCEIDKRILKELFIFAGARFVELHGI